MDKLADWVREEELAFAEPGMCIYLLLEEVKRVVPQTSVSLIWSFSTFFHENKSQFGMPKRSAGVCAQTYSESGEGVQNVGLGH